MKIKEPFSFPNEILYFIITFLDVQSIILVEYTCKLFYQFSKTPEIWENFCNSLIKPQKINISLHSKIVNGSKYEKYLEMYKILRKAYIIKNQEEFVELQNITPKYRSFIFLYPGTYTIENNIRFPPVNIIGLGNKKVKITGGTKQWGILNFEAKGLYLEHNYMMQYEKCLVTNLKIYAKENEEIQHIICVGSPFVEIKNCTLDSKFASATCLNIFGGDTECLVINSKIKNSNKHGIYVGQVLFFLKVGC